MPTVVPTTVTMNTTVSAIISETREPKKMRDKDVATELVGAEEIDGRAVRRAEEVPVGRDEAEQPVAETLDEEAEIYRIGIVRSDDRLEGDRVELGALADLIGARPDEIALLIGDADRLRRREGDTGQLRVHGREELGKDRHQHQQAYEDQSCHAGPGAPQTAPDECEIGLVVMLRRWRRAGQCHGLDIGFHACAPAPRRTRGSSRAKSISAMMLPTISVADRTSMKVAVT